MSFDASSLQTRLATLHANLKHTLQLIQKLSRLQPNDSTNISSNPAVVSDDETRIDLTASIHEQLTNSEGELEILRQDVTDLDSVQAHTSGRSSRRSINLGKDNENQRTIAKCLGGCEKLREELILTRTRFRRAQLTAKASADRAVQRERISYLNSLQAAAAIAATINLSQPEASTESIESKQSKYADLFAGRRPRPASAATTATQDDILLTAASDVTAGLRHTHSLLQANVTQSQFARETLETSNEALKELNTRYDSFDDLIAKSRGLLGTLLRSQKSDTWYLQTASYVLICVIVWLAFRRWVYGPLWWFFWIPLKLVLSMFSGVGYVLGVNGSHRHGPNAVGGTTVLGGVTAGSLPSLPPAVTISSVQHHQAPSNAEEVSIANIGTMSKLGHSATPADSHILAADPPIDVAEQDQSQRAPQNAEPARRGDGQILPERDEAIQPRNPKKRMLEEPVQEDPSQAEHMRQHKQKDEL